MTEIKMNGTRRAFFLRGGAVLGAGVATTAAASALLPDTPQVPDQLQQLQRELTDHQDREAIRQLHLAFTRALEAQAYDIAVELFAAHAALDLSGSAAQGQPAIEQMFATQYRQQRAPVIHSAYRFSPRQPQDLIAIAADGMNASATFHCEVELSSPLPTDSTLAQMARLQGHVAQRHWQPGCFEALYVKTAGAWKMAALRFT